MQGSNVHQENQKTEIELRNLEILPCHADQYPFDIVVLATLWEAFATIKVCRLATLSEQQGGNYSSLAIGERWRAQQPTPMIEFREHRCQLLRRGVALFIGFHDPLFVGSHKDQK
jgi:hypothetical protein